MARITNAILNPDDIVFSNRPGYVPPELDIPPEDPYASHLYLAYEFYGHPFFCATIGDTMGNAIRRKALRCEWVRDNLYSEDHSKTFLDVLGIGLHNQHVIDYNTRVCRRGTLLDLTYYCQIYSVPLLPRRR